MTNMYNPLSLVRVFATFKNDASILTNPTTVTLYLGDKEVPSVTYISGIDVQLTNPSTGYFQTEFRPSDLFPDLYGPVWYRWVTTGAVVVDAQGVIEVIEPKVGP